MQGANELEDAENEDPLLTSMNDLYTKEEIEVILRTNEVFGLTYESIIKG